MKHKKKKLHLTACENVGWLNKHSFQARHYSSLAEDPAFVVLWLSSSFLDNQSTLETNKCRFSHSGKNQNNENEITHEINEEKNDSMSSDDRK